MAEDTFSAAAAAAKIKARKAKIKAAVDATTKGAKKAEPTSSARKVGLPPVSEIKKTKHTGSEGEASYGQQMNEPVFGNTKTRFNQNDG